MKLKLHKLNKLKDYVDSKERLVSLSIDDIIFYTIQTYKYRISKNIEFKIIKILNSYFNIFKQYET